jgi:hypothetical protein
MDQKKIKELKAQVRLDQDAWIAREGKKIFSPTVQGMSHKFRTGLN